MIRSTRAFGMLALALAGFSIPRDALSQDAMAGVTGAPDGWVRLSYAARDGVCGNGRWISIDGNGRFGRMGDREEGPCEPGPVRLDLRVRDGVVRDLEVEVGGAWTVRSGVVTELGELTPARAVDFLFELADRAPRDVAEGAIFPATLARGVETWPRLLALARGDGHQEVREQAIFWLSQEASERAAQGLVSLIDDAGELEVREHAIFALSQRPEPSALDALIGVARTSPEPALRRRAIFWLGQRGDDPRVLAFLEEILTRGG